MLNIAIEWVKLASLYRVLSARIRGVVCTKQKNHLYNIQMVFYWAKWESNLQPPD